MKRILIALLAIATSLTVPLEAQNTTRRVTITAPTGTVPDSAILNAVRPRTDSLRAVDIGLQSQITSNGQADARTAARLDSLIAALKVVVPVPPIPPDTTPTPPPDTVVTPPPTPGGSVVYFNCDWTAALGNSQSALSCGGKWAYSAGTLMAGGLSQVRSTAADGRDFTSPNYLRVINSSANSNTEWAELAVETAQNVIPAVAVGDSVAVEFEYRFMVPDAFTFDNETHGDYFATAGAGSGWGPAALGGYFLHHGLDSRILPGFWLPTVAPGSGSSPTDSYFACRISGAFQYARTNTTYRIAWLYIRTGTNTYRIAARILNANGTVWCDSAAGHFVTDWYGPPGNNLSTTTFTVNGAGAASMQGFKIGTNGGMRFSPAATFAEYGRVRLCSGWC